MSGNTQMNNDPYDIGSVDQGFCLSNGFLPRQDPLQRLPSSCEPWEGLAQALPDWLSTGVLRREIAALPPFPLPELMSLEEYHRAMMVVSFLGHAYIWGEREDVSPELPVCLAVAWYEIAQKIGRPPVLSYTSYALNNWRRLDNDRPISLDNITLLQRFLGGVDEAWFILIHVVIESQAIPALQGMQAGLQAMLNDDVAGLLAALLQLKAALSMIGDTLERMPEFCDPYIYYHRVRPFIHGWRNHPAIPQGIIYSGVAAYGDKPVKFAGETGAQSTIIPAVDAFLGIQQAKDALQQHLIEMLDYAPSTHRNFVLHLQAAEDARHRIIHRCPEPELIDAYNACVLEVDRFRGIHLRYAISYIQQQNQRHSSNPNELGTGGTPFVSYLKKHHSSCQQFLIQS